MNVNVSKESVVTAQNIVRQAEQALVQNHSMIVSEIEGSLTEWKDANVAKFLNGFQGITADLSEILGRLNAIDGFCQEVYNWLCIYLDS